MTDTATPKWFELSIAAHRDQYEVVEAWLMTAGAQSITYFDPEDTPLFDIMDGQEALWDTCHLKGLFDANLDNPEQLLSQASTQFDTAYGHYLEDQCWETTWMEHFKPLQFGDRLWIIPSHHEPVDDQALNILLDPGLAFGSGSHPTTQLCLEWLERVIGHLPSNQADSSTNQQPRVVDYGCGSGILAIAAKKLGAADVYAYDIDPQALLSTKDNADKNTVSLTDIALSPSSTLKPVDVLVANILANPLCDLKPQLLNLLKTGGKIALSGILAEQVEQVKTVYNPEIEWQNTIMESGWILIEGTKTRGE